MKNKIATLLLVLNLCSCSKQPTYQETTEFEISLYNMQSSIRQQERSVNLRRKVAYIDGWRAGVLFGVICLATNGAHEIIDNRQAVYQSWSNYFVKCNQN